VPPQALLRPPSRVTGFLQTLVNGLLLGGVYALAASGLTLVFGVMNVINVAHGAMLILAAYLTYALWTHTGIDPILSILITTPVMFGFGWMLYRGAISRIAGAPASMSVLLTFAIALMIEGSLGLVFKGTFKSVTPSYFDDSIKIGTIYVRTARLYACGTAVVILVALMLVLTKTWLGRAIRASAQNPQVARLVGIDVRAVAAFAFALGVATTGAGGSLISVLYPFLPASHYQWISRLLGVIVLGGMGSLPGAVIGALAIGVGETMTTAYISPEWQTAVPYVVIFVVLLVRPQGILGKRTRQDVVTA
jgi:branched-chain amino acid transport system permease protein